MDSHVLAGRYELHEQIGSGAAATVWRAMDRVLKRPVAVKILKDEPASDPAFVERFRREAYAAASLNHANVVAVYDWGQAPQGGDHGRPVYYMAMEYIAGSDLKDLIARSAPLPEKQAIEIAMSIASALEAAHERGIIHRDIKPHNVLLGTDGRVVVTDFGIAWNPELTDLTMTNSINGTVLYAAPEQVRGQRADRRSDVYSLGVVLYELLTGRVPFTGSTALDVALHHIQDAPVPPREIDSAISPATEAVVLKALEKNPADRFGSAGEIRDALARAERVEKSAPAPALAATAPAPLQAPQRGTRARPPLERPGDRENQRRRGIVPWLAALPLLLVALVAGGAVLLVHGAGGHLAAGPSPTPHPRVARAGTTHARPGHAPVARATSAPTTAPTSPPTSQPTAPPSTSAPAPTAPAAVSVIGANSTPSTPAKAVVVFYHLAAQHDFGAAAALWSDRMRAQYPPSSDIDQRFSGTTAVDIQEAKVVSYDSAAGRATVAVQLVEQTDSGSTRWVGTWDVVRGPNGWLLDQPDLRSS